MAGILRFLNKMSRKSQGSRVIGDTMGSSGSSQCLVGSIEKVLMAEREGLVILPSCSEIYRPGIRRRKRPPLSLDVNVATRDLDQSGRVD